MDHELFFYKLIPAKIINPIDIKPVKSIVIPNPLSGPGMLEYHNFLWIADIAIMAKAQPDPPPKPNTIDSGRL